MFSSLIKKGYVDPDTTEQQMLAIFGKEEFDQPINWLKDLRQLAYFVDTAIAPTNKDYWAATSCCFVVKGETPNRGSLKSALGAVQIHQRDIVSVVRSFLYIIIEKYPR